MQRRQTASFGYDQYFFNSHERRIETDDTFLIGTNIGDKENDTRIDALRKSFELNDCRSLPKDTPNYCKSQ